MRVRVRVYVCVCRCACVRVSVKRLLSNISRDIQSRVRTLTADAPNGELACVNESQVGEAKATRVCLGVCVCVCVCV